jgi:hypothetical protein
MRRVSVLLGAGAVLALIAPRFAAARACGDVAGVGRHVPCACGDVLVGSAVLSDDDPIAHDTCETDGLTIRAADPAAALTLDLAGHNIVGSGRGIGIHVESGGPLAIKGPGTVRAFDIGILARGTSAVVSQIVSVDNRSDGFRVAGQGFAIRDCEARDNGATGFRLTGDDYMLSGSHAAGNGASGFALGGRRAVIDDARPNEASGNGAEGMTIVGREHSIGEITARGNHGAGVRTHVAKSALRPPRDEANGGPGLRAAGHDSVVRTNANGLRMRGARNGVEPAP